MSTDTAVVVKDSLDTIAYITGWIAMPFVFYGLVCLLFAIIVIGFEQMKDTHDRHTDAEWGASWFWATAGSAALMWVLMLKFGITNVFVLSNIEWIIYGAIAYAVTGLVWATVKWFFKLHSIRETFCEIKGEFARKYKLTLKGAFPMTPEERVQIGAEDLDLDELTKHRAGEIRLGLGRYEGEEEAVARPKVVLEEAQRELNTRYFNTLSGRLFMYEHLDKDDRSNRPHLIAQSFKPLAKRHRSRIMQWIAFWPISIVWTLIDDPVRRAATFLFNRVRHMFQAMSDSMFKGI